MGPTTAVPVTPNVPVIDAAVISTADDRPADDRSAGDSPVDVTVDVDVPIDVNVPVDAADVAMDANVPTTDASATTPCVSPDDNLSKVISELGENEAEPSGSVALTLVAVFGSPIIRAPIILPLRAKR